MIGDLEGERERETERREISTKIHVMMKHQEETINHYRVSTLAQVSG